MLAILCLETRAWRCWPGLLRSRYLPWQDFASPASVDYKPDQRSSVVLVVAENLPAAEAGTVAGVETAAGASTVVEPGTVAVGQAKLFEDCFDYLVGS